jgi:outer membrane protein OmpA-like peptidoglycan-associated protein
VTKGKLLAVVIVWLMIAGAVAVGWRMFVKPSLEEQAERERDEVIDQTSGNSRYAHSIDLALDPFSGYAVLRSAEFQQELQAKRVRVQLIDDQADYKARIRALQSGEVQMAAFTIDALVKACADLKDLPAVIVAVIDETRGADAMVASKRLFPNVDSLNHPDTRFVLTPDSPSETLARVVMNQFSLSDIAASPFVMTGSPEETITRYRDAKPSEREVYVIWEPYVSEILASDAMHVVVDSSRFRGYIVDVLVANREYLLKNDAVVRDVVGAYFVAANRNRDSMKELVLRDAKQQRAKLTAQQAAKLVEGIRWKNSRENFAHFGMLPDSGLQHIEDMIANITRVLRETGGIAEDPTEGAPAKLFNERILRSLESSDFSPVLSSDQIVQDQFELPVLTDDQWRRLRPVGELKTTSLVFARGTDRLTGTSQATLDDLVRTLNTWPQYYVLVRGNASRQGPLEANRRLAESRALAAAKYLREHGIHASRVHAIGADPTGQTSVSFVLGEAP